MRILISIDMEGVSGVVARNHVMAEHAEYARFRKLMTAEANAAIDGALAGGATHIIVNDSHAGMTNVLIEELHPASLLISGSPKPLGMMQGIGPEIDAVFLVGYHAASGTGAAVLEHTISGNLLDVQLNGRSVGEMGMNAALAGSYGVPVSLVTGDRAITEEARALLGPIETVAVKDGISRGAAACLSPSAAQEEIRQAAERAVRQRPAPFVVPSPITVAVSFMRTTHADLAELVPGSQRLDGRTVQWTGPDMPAVYRAFRAMAILAGTAA